MVCFLIFFTIGLYAQSLFPIFWLLFTYPLYMENLNRYLTNSEDPDEMSHIAAFHQGLHCLLR